MMSSCNREVTVEDASQTGSQSGRTCDIKWLHHCLTLRSTTDKHTLLQHVVVLQVERRLFSRLAKELKGNQSRKIIALQVFKTDKSWTSLENHGNLATQPTLDKGQEVMLLTTDGSFRGKVCKDGICSGQTKPQRGKTCRSRAAGGSGDQSSESSLKTTVRMQAAQIYL